MSIIELHQAFVWDCENCGKENFVRAIKPELTTVEITDLKREFGIDESEEEPIDGFFLMAPKHVKCDNCGEEFEAEDQA